MKKRILALLLAIACIFTTTGCEDIQIFEEEKDPFKLVPVKDTNLKDDVYYVKDGTNFYSVFFSPAGSARGKGTSSLNETRTIITGKNNSLIPTYYKDELIAFASEEISLSEIVLERFSDLGFSLGCYSGFYTQDGYYYTEADNGTVKDLSLGLTISDSESKDFRIASINGESIKSEDINKKAGTLKGLEKGKTYKIGYYMGTKYYERNMIADAHIYEASEMFYFGRETLNDTQNGYMCFYMPQDMKSGYYVINSAGMFRYYDFVKGEKDEETIDMNESYFTSEKKKIEAYSRQYVINVPRRAKDFKIKVKYSGYNSNSDDIIQGIVFAPDETRYDMDIDESEREITLSMSEAMAGEWTVNISPKTINIDDVKVESDTSAEEATCEEYEFSIIENRENIEFIAEYIPKDVKEVKNYTIFGTILDENGKTYEMYTFEDKIDSKNSKYYIKYEMPFVKAGKYTVRIYHHPEETTISEPVTRDKVKTDTEVIIIDG